MLISVLVRIDLEKPPVKSFYDDRFYLFSKEFNFINDKAHNFYGELEIDSFQTREYVLNIHNKTGHYQEAYWIFQNNRNAKRFMKFLDSCEIKNSNCVL